ncbi:hypothetical protein [Fischerella sp. PCC 9605]|uniref:hypothetical protein n=1 Tax=Fischerella sp. PCC 9605 TaxID=1173024 RepID=UPI000479BD0D|nr:hypothetical protein [Fischerella sp. PCC 9605]
MILEFAPTIITVSPCPRVSLNHPIIQQRPFLVTECDRSQITRTMQALKLSPALTLGCDRTTTHLLAYC